MQLVDDLLIPNKLLLRDNIPEPMRANKEIAFMNPGRQITGNIHAGNTQVALNDGNARFQE